MKKNNSVKNIKEIPNQRAVIVLCTEDGKRKGIAAKLPFYISDNKNLLMKKILALARTMVMKISRDLCRECKGEEGWCESCKCFIPSLDLIIPKGKEVLINSKLLDE